MRADHLIDTTEMSPHDLKAELQTWFSKDAAAPMAVSVQSFSYKRGLPRGLDMIFDCRFLRNPYWNPDLRQKDGRDGEVAAHVADDPRFDDFIARVSAAVPLTQPLFAGYRMTKATEIVSQKIIGNLDKSKAPSDETSLHRVRSDNYLYERNGDLTVDRLTVANYSHPLPNIYTRVSAGLLETMYGGVSAEALW